MYSKNVDKNKKKSFISLPVVLKQSWNISEKRWDVRHVAGGAAIEMSHGCMASGCVSSKLILLVLPKLLKPSGL